MLKKSEDLGGTYRTGAGTAGDALGILESAGANYGRLKVWADPGAQTKPAAWSSHSYNQLTTDVYDHNCDVLNALQAQGTTADMVQIGNEINTGTLWPEGSTDNWNQTAGLLKSGINAAKAVSPSTQTVLHLAHGGDNSLYRWWFATRPRRA